jgi:hypothetical protein
LAPKGVFLHNNLEIGPFVASSTDGGILTLGILTHDNEVGVPYQHPQLNSVNKWLRRVIPYADNTSKLYPAVQFWISVISGEFRSARAARELSESRQTNQYHSS